MQTTRLQVDTATVRGNLSSAKRSRSSTPNSGHSKSKSPFSSNAAGIRLRSPSSASTTSSLSVISPAPSSNASTSSLHLPRDSVPAADNVSTPSLPSCQDSTPDETIRLGSEYVLAMHDFSPQHQNATCLSFRAGQIIHVFNRDSSGWWDGELDGRRGWFPSNYVSSEVDSVTEEEFPGLSHKLSHGYSASVTSWASTPSPRRTTFARNDHRPISEAIGSDIDLYCPPLMIPLLHGLSLLQNAVRAKRSAHFQPSTACIISCVRSILASTECLLRDSPILKQHHALSLGRKRILSELASLVAQAKKASGDATNEGDLTKEEAEAAEIEAMLRLGGSVFALVRRFLVVAVQCGIALPDRKTSSLADSMDTEGVWSQDDSFDQDKCLISAPFGDSTTPQKNGTEHRTPVRYRHMPGTPGSAARAKSMVDLRQHKRFTMDDDVAPLLSHRSVVGKSKKEQYLKHDKVLGHKAAMLSISSTSSSSSFSSVESLGTPVSPPFPSGPSSTSEVMDALRYTHDNYLSTIAAFIGHAHSHSRTSHASSTGHMYDLVREVVEMVCKLLTIVEAVMRHPGVPTHKLGSLKAAKEGLFHVTSSLADSVRLLTAALPPDMTEEEEKSLLLRSATGALKAGADCVSAVKMCLNWSAGDRQFIIDIPSIGEDGTDPFTPSKFTRIRSGKTTGVSVMHNLYRFGGIEDEEDLTIQAQTLSFIRTLNTTRQDSVDGSDTTTCESKSTSRASEETAASSPIECKPLPPLKIPEGQIEPERHSPISFTQTDDGTTWEGTLAIHQPTRVEGELDNGELPSLPSELHGLELQEQALSHDYSAEDVAYNSEGHLVGATLDALVEKMTPHDSIVDPAFSAVFFLTFRLFSTPIELVQAIIARYNIVPPPNLSDADVYTWQRSKGIPVRLRVSNFIKLWLETYWRPSVDNIVLMMIETFTQEALAPYFAGPSQRILDLIEMRMNTTDAVTVSPKSDRIRDPGMSINPPSVAPSEIPRPTMTKTLLAALRNKYFDSIAITDFDALELARQLTIMECNLYCAIQPEEVLETGQEGAKSPVNVRAMSTLSTVITGWVAESILKEPDVKKRTALVKFFIKVADRCTSMNNYSTPRSILAALDSSTISRLHHTWTGLPQKSKTQLESLRRVADHGRNYHEYRSRLRNTAPPAVPFLGLYLTDVTFCREGNPSHRSSPSAPSKKLLNFNKYHKLARIVQDMQRFQVPYNLKAIPEVQEYLNVLFESSKHYGDLQDLYRRSLLVEPKQPADTPPSSDMRQLFSWATRSQSQPSQA